MLTHDKVGALFDVLRLCSIRHFALLSVPTQYTDCLIALLSGERMMLGHARAAG